MRICVLVAPAGFGKTTLADQWVTHGGRTGARFRARPSSVDVAALALDLAEVASAIVPGCDHRLREHLRAAPSPAEHPVVLAEILGEDLEDWPERAWLVIDEYHELAPAPEAERFVGALVDASRVQFMIASRLRPSWAPRRKVVYGEVFELTQDDLAMDEREAAEVLAGRSETAASELTALAGGWPAVIGLASVSPAEPPDTSSARKSLYEFFAEEVFAALDGDVQRGLVRLATPPVLDRALAATLLGSERATSVCSAALDLGSMVERDGFLELHPLTRSFLESRRDFGSSPEPDTVHVCLEHYRERHDWEAAYELTARFDLASELESTLALALDELLDTARLTTIEAWLELSTTEIEAPICSVARAELALRRGRFAEAQAHGELAAAAESESTFRALSVAGRAAHLASREEEALALYERAESIASTELERRSARWGQVSALVDLERGEEALAGLEVLHASTPATSPLEIVRSATLSLGYQLKLGSVSLEAADRAYELLGAVQDPISRSGFQSVYAAALALAARYDEALSIAADFLDTTERYRLEFARLYALCPAATAHAGRREWQAAHDCVQEALGLARAGRNAYAEHLCRAIAVRILTQQGRLEAAAALPGVERRCTVPSARAELSASRALALAALSRLGAARALVEEVRGASQAIEPRVLGLAAEAVVALRGKDPGAAEHAHQFLRAALGTGAIDLLVTTYRAVPELLTLLLRDEELGETAAAVLRGVGDDDVALAAGHSVSLDDPAARLSPRERDVYAGLRSGMTNLQIAELLVISEETVKVHVHHIFDKIGIRSRAAIAVQARLERPAQATSATSGNDAVDGSSGR